MLLRTQNLEITEPGNNVGKGENPGYNNIFERLFPWASKSHHYVVKD